MIWSRLEAMAIRVGGHRYWMILGPGLEAIDIRLEAIDD